MKLLQQNHIKYGLIMCGVIAVCLLLMEVTGQNQTFDNKSPFQVILMFIAPAVIWFFGIKAKKKILKNKMTFKQGLNEGIKISLVYAVVSPFIFVFYYLFINPPILEYVREAYSLTGASDMLVITVDMVIQFAVALIFGTIYAAIISFFLKSKS